VLFGSEQDSSLPTIYVGEGDPVKDRLNQHYSKKDFWDSAVFFVSKDNSLNKAHVKYLESKLLDLARLAKQSKIDNAHPSWPPTLSEAEIADVESFLLDMLSIFPLLGYGVFEKTETVKRPRDVLMIDAKAVHASGYEGPKGFVVCEGSQAVKDDVPSIHQYLATLRKDLLEQGILTENGQHLLFSQDQVFNSPSTAAGVVLGRSANGRIEWRAKDGRTLKELQSATAGLLERDEN
jgi:hypothetical protein